MTDVWCVAVGSDEFLGDYTTEYRRVSLSTALEIAESLRKAGKTAWALPDFFTIEYSADAKVKRPR